MRRLVSLAACCWLLVLVLGGCAGRTQDSGARACLANLDRHRIAYTPVAVADPSNAQCIIDNAVRVSRIEARLNRAATMSCAMASRLDQFEREVVQPMAMRDLGRNVAEIEHLGSYACRANTGVRGRLSEHAYGRAFDIAAFRFTDGTVANIEIDWSRPGPYRNFLRHVARSACSYFSVVLTPDSNRDHYNHFHFDIGPGKLCSGV